MNLIKTKVEIEKIKESSRILKIVKENLKSIIKPGVSLIELEEAAKQIIFKEDATPSFLGYNGFPSAICTSVNDVLIHGIANNYVLKEGDILSIDIGVYKNSYHSDSAFTVGVGEISKRNKELIDITKECLELAIEKIRDGTTLGEIGEVIEKHAKSHKFYLTKEFAGHGVGKSLHEEPFVFNHKKSRYSNFVLKAGMVIAVEPMLLIDSEKVYIDPLDNWSVRSKKHKNTAHFEHTVLVEEDGAYIFT